MKRMHRRAALSVSAILMAAALILIYVPGLLIPETAVAGSFQNAGLPPSFAHPFGTDALGRDLMMRTLKGLSVSLTIGFLASAVSAVIAVCAGIAAASGFSLADALVGWLTDLVMGIPHTILVILISFALGRGLPGLFAGIAATHWCSLARLIRAEVLQLRSQPYIMVSRRLGRSGAWILSRHMLPHLLPQFFVGLVLMLPHAILHEASVSFLGFGLAPEQPSIGIILSESMRYLSAGMWWPAVLPGLTLVAIVLFIDRTGDCLQRILDPVHAQE